MKIKERLWIVIGWYARMCKKRVLATCLWCEEPYETLPRLLWTCPYNVFFLQQVTNHNPFLISFEGSCGSSTLCHGTLIIFSSLFAWVWLWAPQAIWIDHICFSHKCLLCLPWLRWAHLHPILWMFLIWHNYFVV